jgi:hypothetical protein
MSGIQLFTPKAQGTRQITCANTTATVALAIPPGATTMRIKNSDTTNIGYVNFGDSTVTCVLPSGSTLGGMPVGPGETVGVGIPPATTSVATICSAGTPILYFTPGNGV